MTPQETRTTEHAPRDLLAIERAARAAQGEAFAAHIRALGRRLRRAATHLHLPGHRSA